MQSKSAVHGLIEELRGQIEQYCAGPAVLIGHSWGAWLSGLTAARYPELVSKLILIGCGPLDEKYVGEIGLRREKNMSREEYAEYKELLLCLDKADTADKDVKLARLGAIAGKADGFDEAEDEQDPADALPADGSTYALIMPEAAKLRKNGHLLAEFRRIKCPIVIIQGEADPHPAEGVIEPLSDCAVKLKTYALGKCGHTPWKEKHAKAAFYQILFSEINKGKP
jgi:pimeloyl-ACP methyl ester carboxylesterase